MKIEEPKTPFEVCAVKVETDDAYGNYSLQVYESDGDEPEELDANLLAAKIAAEGNKGPRPRRFDPTPGY